MIITYTITIANNLNSLCTRTGTLEVTKRHEVKMCKRVLKSNSVEEEKKKNQKLVRWSKALCEISKDLDF